ncbi:MAG TPA: alpha/beta hydrolase [Candidatus Pacearchaeota archaeon]|nr:alpha/beta hydrolase [Candidatus Pacearchaeota archaeon]
MNNKELNIQGIKIKYKQEGTGTPIVILHGWGGSSKSWEKIIELIAGKKYMVICPDLPGFGESDTLTESWNINKYVSFVLEFLKTLKIEECILIGHSFGGGLSTKIAAKNPQVVQKLILCDAAVVRAKERLNLRQKIAKISAAIVKPFTKNKFYKEKIQSKLRPFIYKIAGTRDYFNANEVMKETFVKISKEDLRAFATYIKKPTLVVWGDKDEITPLEDAYTIKNIIDGAKLCIINDVAHSPHLKKPEELADIIIDFINEKV